MLDPYLYLLSMNYYIRQHPLSPFLHEDGLTC
jgi:hypothetical protein